MGFEFAVGVLTTEEDLTGLELEAGAFLELGLEGGGDLEDPVGGVLEVLQA